MVGREPVHDSKHVDASAGDLSARPSARGGSGQPNDDAGGSLGRHAPGSGRLARGGRAAPGRVAAGRPGLVGDGALRGPAARRAVRARLGGRGLRGRRRPSPALLGREGQVTLEPKTRAGRRTVPLASTLRAHLREHKLYTARRSGLVFGTDGVKPPDPDAVSQRALRCWTKTKPMPLTPIGLHECRHTFASLSVTITFDRYGHLMPGNEEQAAGLLDVYLEASTAARPQG